MRGSRHGRRATATPLLHVGASSTPAAITVAPRPSPPAWTWWTRRVRAVRCGQLLLIPLAR
jgi:hypothetical protein